MFQEILKHIKKDYPDLRFKKADDFLWSPKDNTIHYSKKTTDDESVWSLLHELSHARLNHTQFSTDFDLLNLEVAAWEEAKTIAPTYGADIDTDHIENCLDTYRDWIHLRSKCPVCEVHALQSDAMHYECHNCGSKWMVSASRFCRVHRKAVAK